jgi:CRISPR-associated endonuclease/helicase Cas3
MTTTGGFGSAMADDLDFEKMFLALMRNEPFPWQGKLFERFRSGTLERSLDIPTGLGKTAVMAIWLIARALEASLPRRLVYVVDRRAVVDQATDVARRLRESLDANPELKRALGLGDRSLPISTLRGQHVDNKEWLEDPASPAIIVGTIDMIGSRLIFEGYGTSRKMRPYHAGLLGADTLAVLDEAHLVPPFEELLEAITAGQEVFGPRDDALRRLVPPFKLLSLSATSRALASKSFGLQDADLRHRGVRRRLDALKRLSVRTLDGETKLRDTLADEAWKLSENGAAALRIIVFCDKREDAVAVRAAIEARAKGNKKEGLAGVEVETELFVGGRRVFEREEAQKWLMERGFIAGSQVKPTRPTFVISTSAGEVGVDLDADHMVSDLVAWERMVQRLGRVNRRGDGDARVIIVADALPAPKKSVQEALEKAPSDRTEKDSKTIAEYEATIERAKALRKPIDLLPLHEDGVWDASPGALRELKLSAEENPPRGDDADSHVRAWRRAILDAASTAIPLRPALSRALVDAWSMTSLKEHSGRPEIDPWLRGWKEDDPPQTSVVWRTHLPVRKGKEARDKEIEAFFEAAPPHASEVLEAETFRVVEWLTARANALHEAAMATASAESEETANGQDLTLRKGEVVAIALSGAGDVLKSLKLNELEDLERRYNDESKKARQAKRVFKHFLHGATLVIDARLGGLRAGLLNGAEDRRPRTVDDGEEWLMTAKDEPTVRFRVRLADASAEQVPEDKRQWRQRLRFPSALSDEGEPERWLIVEKWLFDAATEDDRSEGHPQLLATHQSWAESRAREIAKRLGLPGDYTEMLAVAARLHDEGKRAKRWQSAFRAPSSEAYAKTLGPVNVALLDGYRHELGSLPVAEGDAGFLKLSTDLQDLALHLIAAHHGFARPIIGVGGCEDAPPSALEKRAREVALRFARLQKSWGPWGLAWWEALLRAADQQASRDNETADSAPSREDV